MLINCNLCQLHRAGIGEKSSLIKNWGLPIERAALQNLVVYNYCEFSRIYVFLKIRNSRKRKIIINHKIQKQETKLKKELKMYKKLLWWNRLKVSWGIIPKEKSKINLEMRVYIYIFIYDLHLLSMEIWLSRRRTSEILPRSIPFGSIHCCLSTLIVVVPSFSSHFTRCM